MTHFESVAMSQEVQDLSIIEKQILNDGDKFWDLYQEARTQGETIPCTLLHGSIAAMQNMLVMKKRIRASDAENLRLQQKVKELMNQFELAKSTAQAELSKASEANLLLSHEYNCIKTSAGKLSALLDTAKDECRNLNKQLSNAHRTLDQSISDIQHIKIDNNRLSESLDLYKNEIIKLNTENEKLKTSQIECTIFNKNISNLNAELSNVTIDNKKLQDSLKLYRNELVKLSIENESLTAQFTEKDLQLSNLKVKNANLSVKTQDQNELIQQLTAKNEILEAKQADLTGKLVQSLNINADLSRKVSEKANLIIERTQQSTEEIQKLSDQIKWLQTCNLAYKKQVKDQYDEINSIQAQNKEQKENIATLTQQNADISSQFNNIKQKYDHLAIQFVILQREIEEKQMQVTQQQQQLNEAKIQIQRLQRIKDLARHVAHEYSIYTKSELEPCWTEIPKSTKLEDMKTANSMRQNLAADDENTAIQLTFVTETFSQSITQDNTDLTTHTARQNRLQLEINGEEESSDNITALYEEPIYVQYTGMYTAYSNQAFQTNIVNSQVKITEANPINVPFVEYIGVYSSYGNNLFKSYMVYKEPNKPIHAPPTPQEIYQNWAKRVVHKKTNIRDLYNIKCFTHIVQQLNSVAFSDETAQDKANNANDILRHVKFYGQQIQTITELDAMLFFNQYVEHAVYMMNFTKKFNLITITDEQWKKLFTNIESQLFLPYVTNSEFVVAHRVSDGQIFKASGNADEMLDLIGDEELYDVIIFNTSFEEKLLGVVKVRSLIVFQKKNCTISLEHPEELITTTLYKVSIDNISNCNKLRNLSSFHNTYRSENIENLKLDRLYSQDDKYVANDHSMLEKLMKQNDMGFIRVLDGQNIASSIKLANIGKLRFLSVQGAYTVTLNLEEENPRCLTTLHCQNLKLLGVQSDIERFRQQTLVY